MTNDKAREEIAKLLEIPLPNSAVTITDAILTKLRSLGYVHLDDEIGGEVGVECPNKDKHWYSNPIGGDDKDVPCKVCGYTGQHKSSDKLTRPRTIRDAIGGK